MKKTYFVATVILALFLSATLISRCKVETNKNDYLKKVLANLEKIKTATYFSTLDVYMPGDTAPSAIRHSYFKEFTNLSDTSVGAKFLKFMGEDTIKLIYEYDGIKQAWIDWDKKTVENDDFQKNPYPFRVVMAPFMTYAKTIIKYALDKTDSIKIDKKDFGDSIQYIISCYDQYLEFVGKIPVPVFDIPTIPDGSAKGKISKYDIWVNKSNGLPYKIKRDMIFEISVNSISNIKLNDKKFEDIKVSDYFPPDYSMLIKGKQKSLKTILEGKKSPDWTLTDFTDNKIALKDLKSKVVMIQFTGIGCGPCRMSIQFLRDLVTEYKNKDFEFLSIEAWDKNIDAIKRYHNNNEMNYNLLMSTEDVTKSYHVEMVPTFFILDKNRVIKKVIEGYDKEKTEKEIKDDLNELI
ncbi:MAG: redoxin domain-containing protein [Bacteroidales bacterium]